MQNQTNRKHFCSPEDIFKSAKIFLEKLNPKKNSTITTIFTDLSKILNRKKTSKQQYNLCQTKNFVEFIACNELLISKIN